MSMTLKEKLFAAGKPTFEEVFVPGMDEPVKVWPMTALEQDRFDAGTFDVGEDGKAKFKHEHYRARLFIASVRDADGVPVFGPNDLRAVSDMSAALLNRVCDAARRINVMGADRVEASAKN